MKLTARYIRATATAAATVCFCAGRSSAGGIETLSLDRGARAAVFGKSFVSIADETTAINSNPAGLAFMYSPEVWFSHGIIAGDDRLSAFGYSIPTDGGTFALGLDYFAGPELARITDGVARGAFSYYTGAGNFAYAARLGETFAFGLDFKHAIDVIDDSVANLTSADAGVLIRTRDEGFSVGAAATNLAISASDNIVAPRTYRGGFSFKLALPEHYSDIIIAFGAEGTDGKKPVYSAALEHVGAKTLAIRVGYNYILDEYRKTAEDSLSAFHAGVGLRLGNFQFNYAYKPLASLGEVHRVDVQWRLYGWGLRKQKTRAALKVEPAVFSPNGDGAKDNVFFIPEITTLRRVDSWELKITSGAATVKSFAAKETPPQIIAWDGKDTSGRAVAEGTYRVLFSAEDKHKTAVSDDKTIKVDLTPPTVSLSASTTVFAPTADGLGPRATFYMQMADESGLDFWQISFVNFMKKNVKVIRSTETPKNQTSWNGLDDYYETAVPAGEYTATLTGVDNGGNRASASLKITVAPRVETVVREIVRVVDVKEETRGLVMTLASNVLFEMGKFELRPHAKKALDEVVEILKTYHENKVLIEGHTDATGSAERNRVLSSKRAWGVYSYLVKSGVEPARISVKGMGQEKPVASNANASGRAINRRVEIIIQKMPPAAAEALPSTAPARIAISSETAQISVSTAQAQVSLSSGSAQVSVSTAAADSE